MSIRLRIALWTAGIMLLSLLALSAGVYYTMSRNLREDVDIRLRGVYDGFRRDPGSIVRDGLTGKIVGIRLDPDPFASTGAYVQVLDPDRVVQARSANLTDQHIPLSPSALAKNDEFDAVYYNASVNGEPIRVYTAPLVGESGIVAYVQVAERLNPLYATLDKLRFILLLGSVLATIALTAAAWLISGAALRPLARMSRAAGAIGRGPDLSHRVEAPRTGDEVQHLAETFNDMLGRLESNFNAQRRFVADASHELRTPLTALRANSEIMLRQVENGLGERDDLLEGLSDMRDEVDRMSRLVHNLLILARADVGWRPELSEVDLIGVARSAARIASPLRRGHELVVDLGPLDGEDRELLLTGNADQLTQLMLILLDNAFTYTPPETRVTLRVDQAGDEAIVTVIDTGQGIPPEHRERIFERFYRTDEARTRASGGTGLGLAIARWIVNVHKGQIDVESEVGAGTTFTVRLPMTDNSVTLAQPRERRADAGQASERPAVAATH